MLLMTIDKFDPNLVLVNINKLKLYRCVKDHIFQPVIAKLNDLLSKESVETNHYNNMFTKELIEVNHFNDLFIEGLVETNHYGNLFIEELVEFHTKDMAVDDPIETRTIRNLSNQTLVKKGISDMLERQSFEEVFVNPIHVQINDVSVNLMLNVSFIEKIFPKGHTSFQAPAPLILRL